MKRKLLLLCALLLAGLTAFSQRTTVLDEVRADYAKAAGVEGIYPMTDVALTPAPKGYEAFYIAHYGRHGSRYAWRDKPYTQLIELLEKAKVDSTITPFGERFLDSLKVALDKVKPHIGTLTDLGWEQHKFIGTKMVRDFPSVFKKGSVVDAVSSPSMRCVLSMSSCCLAIQKAAPQASVTEHQRRSDLQATRPGDKNNPKRYKGPKTVFPVKMSNDDFLEMTYPEYRQIIARLVTNPDEALKGKSTAGFMYEVCTLAFGQPNLPESDRINTDSLITRQEIAALFESGNYNQFKGFLKVRTDGCGIVDDIVDKANVRIASGFRGADLRFGHDSYILSTLLVMNLDGFGTEPSSPKDVAHWFQLFRSPMAANIQYVFYKPVKNKKGDILVKVLLNGEEVSVGQLDKVSGPYYKWDDVAKYLRSRTDIFVDR
ncbi:MAG: hypothetical protein J5632_04045 [Bacteroidales bacterium]|nr:hypothetical protein [Bacteroidales bacterium]